MRINCMLSTHSREDAQFAEQFGTEFHRRVSSFACDISQSRLIAYSLRAEHPNIFPTSFLSLTLITIKCIHLQKFPRGYSTHYTLNRGSVLAEPRAPDTTIHHKDSPRTHRIYISPNSHRVRVLDPKPKRPALAESTLVPMTQGTNPSSTSSSNISSRIFQFFSSVTQHRLSTQTPTVDNPVITADNTAYDKENQEDSMRAQQLLTLSQPVPATPGKKRFVSSYLLLEC